MTAAYEIGYYSGDEWTTLEIISAETHGLYPDKLAYRLKYNQSWEMTKERAKERNFVGHQTWTHLPGSTIIRVLAVSERCTKCDGTGEKTNDFGDPISCICDGEGTRLAQLEGELQEYADRGY